MSAFVLLLALAVQDAAALEADLRALRAPSIEEERARCRAIERSGPEHGGWRHDWEQARAGRDALREHVAARLAPWLAELRERVAAADASARAGIAAECAGVLDAWVAVGEPRDVLADLRASEPAFATALAWLDDGARRRGSLNAIVERLTATPGESALDTLRDTVDWETLFLRETPSPRARLELLSGDLVLLFTERGLDGYARSGAGSYQSGRMGESGFAPELRDGSDQVRHFAWALRVLTVSQSFDQGDAMLRLKEERDSLTRGKPIEAADLRLNALAREFAEALVGERGRGMRLQRYAAWLDERLGPGKESASD